MILWNRLNGCQWREKYRNASTGSARTEELLTSRRNFPFALSLSKGSQIVLSESAGGAHRELDHLVGRCGVGDDGNRRDAGTGRATRPPQTGGDRRDRAAGEKRQRVAVRVVVDGSAARRHERSAELVREEYPAVDARDRALAESVGGERDHRRHRREPIEAV